MSALLLLIVGLGIIVILAVNRDDAPTPQPSVIQKYQDPETGVTCFVVPGDPPALQCLLTHEPVMPATEPTTRL